jgi:two-component system chemotaxis response regulator CheV
MSPLGSMNILLENQILLESGTNELEILVFEVADFTFGINVAKVREVLPLQPITSLPKAHASVRGIFKLRNQVIPCVSLVDHLGIAPTRDAAETEATMILTDLNQQQTAFLVDRVERIHRLSWEHVLPVPALMALAQTPVTALARCGERLIVMLDFEMILSQVSGAAHQPQPIDNPHGLDRAKLRLLLADDSPTVRQAVGATLRTSGYTNVEFFENGQVAWQHIERSFQETGDVTQVADLLISDVEMPQIDGFHLCKRIKEHPELRRLPVLLYSSIVTPDNHKKGAAVGADGQVAKPELDRVVEMADAMILRAQQAQGRTSSPATPASAAKASVAAAEPQLAPVAASVSAAPRVAPPPASTVRYDAPAAAPAAVTTFAPSESLLVTYCQELRQRVETLTALIETADSGQLNADTLREIFRTLHTIKSASQVVPLDEVSHVTHQVESLLAGVLADLSLWPVRGLVSYVDWLDSIADCEGEPGPALSMAPLVEADLLTSFTRQAL